MLLHLSFVPLAKQKRMNIKNFLPKYFSQRKRGRDVGGSEEAAILLLYIYFNLVSTVSKSSLS